MSLSTLPPRIKGEFPTVRMRRLRSHPRLRDLVRETELNVNDFVCPIFIKHGLEEKNPIKSMPGLMQIGMEHLAEEVREIQQLGIPAVLLFGIPATKDAHGSDSYCDSGIIQNAIKIVKDTAPEILVISDICFCEYTDHGHCGVISERDGRFDVDNELTLELLAQQAVSHAKAGTDVIAPSGMIDGMVRTLRQALDHNHYQHVPILSYAVKYASSLYGPFREAAEGPPKFGDRSTYQMDIANSDEAMREASLDVMEGADMLMVKPALAYLDIIYRAKQLHPELPMGAYQVSGEYAMIKAAAMNGWLDERKTVLESLIAIKRAGADFIISYFAKDVARWLTQHK